MVAPPPGGALRPASPDSTGQRLGRGLGSALASALLSLAPHPFLAAAPVALPLLLALAPAAQAQTVQTLVSNLNEDESTVAASHVGIKFTTGSSAVTLTDVRIMLGGNTTGSITIRIRDTSTTQSATNPTGTIVATLNNPSSLTANVVNTFTAPDDTVLEASTTYFLEIDASSNMHFTDSTAQTGLTGWSIADTVREFFGGSWSEQADLPKFELRGSINPPEISLMTPNLEGVSRVMNESRVPENSSRSGTTFTVSSDVNAPSGGLSVCLAISESGGDRLAATSEGVKTVTIASGSSTGTHSLPAWTNDSDSERPSRVTLRVLPPSDSNCSSTDSYTVSADDDTVAFTILEDDDLNVAVTSADSAMIEGIATETATVTVTLARRLYAGETATVHLDLSTTTGASLPDGDGMTEDDFAVTAAGTGVTASGLDDSGPILVFTGHDTNTVRTATLTFTPTAGRSDGDTAEDTVTVSFDGNNSFIRPGDIAALTGPPANVDLTLEEPPLAPPTVSIARQGSAAVIEGANVVFRVTASRAVSANLTVNLNVGDTSNGNADFVSTTHEGSQSVTIAAGATTADFTLSTEGDTTDEVDGAVGVVVVSGTGYTVGSPSSAQVTVQDNDPTRVTLSVPDATATEGSSSDRATVRLALNRALRSGESLAIPLGFSGGVLGTDFSLSLSGSPTGVALSGSTVTFSGIGVVSATSADVLLSASEDVDAVDETVTVSIPSASSGTPPILTANALLGGGATGSRTGNGEIVLSDDDTAALVFSATSLTVAEGSSGSYTVKLATQPTGNVTVTVGGATGDVTVDTNSGSPGNQNTLSFTTTTWNTAQTVTVAAGEDVDTTNDSATLSHTAAGGGYNSVTGNVAVTVTDDDTAGLVFSPTSLTVAEGSSNSYTVRLATLPTGTVTVTVGGATGDVTVDTNSGSPGNQNTLSFTTTTWNTAQTVTVAAGEDDDTTNDSATLAHTA
ncbi:MAG: hypothetical protein OXC96_09150, partial [Cyanobacteria bacterium MAG CAR1_bin_15]|nr:hypothetical protein [Cyanobacteria bacterium MAG CAR1_bin_15]